MWAFLVKQKLSSLQQLQEGETASDGPTLPEYEKIKDGPTEYQQVITLDLGTYETSGVCCIGVMV